LYERKAFKSAFPTMPEIREPSVEGINKTFRLAAQFLSIAVRFLLVTACSTVDLGLSPKSSLEWKRRSGLRRLHVGLVGIVTGSVPGATLYQTFEHEHDLVAATRRCAPTQPSRGMSN
jgi:hypothetical protein